MGETCQKQIVFGDYTEGQWISCDLEPGHGGACQTELTDDEHQIWRVQFELLGIEPRGRGR